MLAHSPRAFPWEQDLPWALARLREIITAGPEQRRPRIRKCLRKGCRRRYQARNWNQRYCQDPKCLRLVRRWQAARRRPNVARMTLSKPSTPRQRRIAVSESSSRPRRLKTPKLYPRAWSRTPIFFLLPVCDRPGCYKAPKKSVRNRARYCCAACRQAVRKVQDRERKWLSRGTLDGRKKRSFEYRAARKRRVPQQGSITNPSPLRAPPD